MRVAGVRPWARCALFFATMTAVAAHHSQDPDKRSDTAAVPFAMGSRYGRSESRALSPRNDRKCMSNPLRRFYMGTRYGKRSSNTGPSFRDEEATLRPAKDESDRRLVCEYTGIPSFYRCVREKRTQYDKRSSEIMPGEEESD